MTRVILYSYCWVGNCYFDVILLISVCWQEFLEFVRRGGVHLQDIISRTDEWINKYCERLFFLLRYEFEIVPLKGIQVGLL